MRWVENLGQTGGVYPKFLITLRKLTLSSHLPFIGTDT